MSRISSEWKLSLVHQRFSLPAALVFYMAKNPPSPEVYHKLIKCCKYFWLKNPVITLERLCLHDHDTYWRTDKTNGFQERRKFKIENMNGRLWFRRILIIDNEQDQFLASSLIPRIYRWDLTHLTLTFQTLTFNEFQKFTSSGSLKCLDLKKTIVKNDDGTVVPIQKLVELLPKLQRLYYDNFPKDEGGLQTITSETAVKLVAIPHFPKLKIFEFKGVPESFDIEAFFAVPKVSTSIFN